MRGESIFFFIPFAQEIILKVYSISDFVYLSDFFSGQRREAMTENALKSTMEIVLKVS